MKYFDDIPIKFRSISFDYEFTDQINSIEFSTFNATTEYRRYGSSIESTATEIADGLTE